MRAKLVKLDKENFTVKLTLAPEATPENDAEIKKLEELVGKWTNIKAANGNEKSRNANSYLWVLCELIAQATERTKKSIYRDAVREAGRWTDVECRADAYDALARGWCMNGTGWLVEHLAPADEFGMIQARLYYGSSTYDAAELGRLIDWCVEECRELGIETKTDEELNSLLAEWGKKNG